MATKKKATSKEGKAKKNVEKPAKKEVSTKSVAAKKPASKKADEGAGGESKTKKEAMVEPVSQPVDVQAPATQNADTGEGLLDGVGLPASSGKAGVLGGPKDRGIKADDKLALPTGKFFTFERVHSLNPKSFYCAMRWDYRAHGTSPEEGKRWWANKKILVTNPTNGNQVVVRAVDYGPHESTGLTISLSPGALEALGIEIGDEVEITFADQKSPLGII